MWGGNETAMRNFTIFILILLIAALFVAAACGGDDDDDSATEPDDDTPPGDDDDNDDNDDDNNDDDNDDDNDDTGLPWLSAVNGPRPGIYDDNGRQILLRGVNFNHLGDYFETHSTLPTVAELGPDDWDDAAALGHNVIRLVTTWSAWQPERGAFDTAYLERVKAAVAEANARGMYVVIDMHQDAWSKFVFTPVDEVCPEGTGHQRGWDGAPAWATFTDGEPTCTPGGREDSPAVIRAWDSFYANREGIRQELAWVWGEVAREFAHESGVAGFDLINEPGTSSDLLGTMRGITTFYREASAAIRAAESEVGARGHIVFFEPSVHGAPPLFGLRLENSVFAPHNYFESIVHGPEGLLDFSFWLYNLLGKIYATALWIGEYNSFSDPATNEEWTRRFAALEDGFLFDGGAWWQWEQECGDPHNAQYPPTPAWLEQQQERCGEARFEVSTCLGRAYPRATPGKLTAVSAEPCGETLFVAGQTDADGVAELWFPTESEQPPIVTGQGVGAAATTRVEGGWLIDVPVMGTFQISVDADGRAFR
jgi:endoglycosylceramidase